jgi:hypothetical protein
VGASVGAFVGTAVGRAVGATVGALGADQSVGLNVGAALLEENACKPGFWISGLLALLLPSGNAVGGERNTNPTVAAEITTTPPIAASATVRREGRVAMSVVVVVTKRLPKVCSVARLVPHVRRVGSWPGGGERLVGLVLIFD